MKKLLEIPFNHKLIGKDGIVIKYRNGKEPLQVVWLDKSKHSQPIISVPPDGESINREHFLNGIYYRSKEKSVNDLIMYQEVEVKELREVFVIETLSGEIVCTVQTIKQAENIIHHLALTKNYKYKITKFIEVIEEGE